MTNRIFTLQELPPPPPGRTGFPWTQGSRPLPRSLPGNAPYPKFSIVTPSFKQGQYLEETIRSVLLQGYPNLEYFVIDGGSPDNSVEIIQKYAPFLDYWVSERDKGQTDAINKGFARSTGSIMGWLNSDDILLPGALYQIAKAFRDPVVNLVTGFRKNIDEHSNVISNFVRDVPNNYYLAHYCTLAQETTYWRREVWNRLGKLDDTLQFAMDYEYWLRAIKRGGYSFHLIPHYIGGFRDYAQNKSSSWVDVYYRDMNTLYRRYDIGEDEADVHTKLGSRWARRYALYVHISKQRWTNLPQLVRLAWRLLENPRFCDAVLAVGEVAAYYAKMRQTEGKSPPAALLAALGRIRSYLGEARHRSHGLSPNVGQLRWGEVLALPSATEVGPTATECLAWGNGWQPLEVYNGVAFRWSAGESTIAIIGRGAAAKRLQMQIAAAMPDEENVLEWVDADGSLIEWISTPGTDADVSFDLGPGCGETVLFRLRWRGKTLQEHGINGRRLAFRVLRIGWETPVTQIALTAEGMDHAVRYSDRKTAIQRLPLVGKVVSVVRHLRNTPAMMRIQRDFWTQFANSQIELDGALDRQKWLVRHPPHLLIDVSTDYVNNNGDMAMFAVLLRRIRARYPHAHIRIVTNDPEGIRRLDPTVEPVVVGLRHHWHIETALNMQFASTDKTALFHLETDLRRAAPDAYWSLVAETDRQSAFGGKRWTEALDEADAVILTGGGYFTDAFAGQAVAVLTTLGEGLQRGLPAFIVGCGFEPVTDPVLSSLAHAILPRLTGITCREGAKSRDVLASFDVSPQKFVVTGDDAIEVAYEARPATCGSGIGVNLRDASYNVVEEAGFSIVKRVLHSFAREKSAPLLPSPISNYEPSDAETIRRVLVGYDDNNDGGATLNSLETLLPQIAGCRVMVTGSYHAAVFALSMGIPAVCLTASSHYQHKMHGLLAMFNAHPNNRVLALDDGDLEARLSAALRDAWEGAQAERETLLAAAQAQIARGRAAYATMFNHIDHQRYSRQQVARVVADVASRLTSESAQTVLGVLRDLKTTDSNLREERDFLQHHADERLRIINTLLSDKEQSAN